jgi:hypothetical protein
VASKPKSLLVSDVESGVLSWPKHFTSLLLDEPLPAKQQPNSHLFIKLCYQLKAQKTALSIEQKHLMQKLFAYLLTHVTSKKIKYQEKKQMFLCYNLLALYPGLINTKGMLDEARADVEFILKHIPQSKRSWIKICIAQALRARAQSLSTLDSRNKVHDKVLDAAYVGSELANVGILLQEVVGGVILGQEWIDIGIAVSRFTNPIIYGFKAIQRGFKLVGRKYFNLEFEEDEVGINPKQNTWDGISGSIFLAVMVLLIINTPFLNALAWFIAPIGLGIVWKSEYGYQNQRAADRLENMKASQGVFDETTQAEAARVAVHKKIASYALFGVILFITLGMLAVYAAGIPGLDLLFNEHTLGALTLISGASLAALALIRAGNFFWERQGTAVKRFFAHPIDTTLQLGKAMRSFIVSTVQSVPSKANSLFYYLKNEFPGVMKSFGDSLYKGPKLTWFFTITSLALSISAFAGGIPVISGLIAAGMCLGVSNCIKYGPSVYATISLWLASKQEEEPVVSFTPKSCREAITLLEQDLQLAVHEDSIGLQPKQVTEFSTEPTSGVFALGYESVVQLGSKVKDTTFPEHENVYTPIKS